MAVLLRLCLFFCVIVSYGHNVDEAFFTITTYDETVELHAEFPWSIRNALLKSYPYLEQAKNDTEFETAFFDYIKMHVQLFDISNKPFVLKSIKALAKDGHAHHNNYLLIFEGKQLQKIKNTVLFNVYNKQKNYHTLVAAHKNHKFITTATAPEFILKEEKNKGLWYLLGGVLLCVLFLFKNKYL